MSTDDELCGWPEPMGCDQTAYCAEPTPCRVHPRCSVCARFIWQNEVGGAWRHDNGDASHAAAWAGDPAPSPATTPTEGPSDPNRWTAEASNAPGGVWRTRVYDGGHLSHIAWTGNQATAESLAAQINSAPSPRIDSPKENEMNPLPEASQADMRRVLGDPPFTCTEGIARDVMRRAGFSLPGEGEGEATYRWPFNEATGPMFGVEPDCQFDHPHPGHPCGQRVAGRFTAEWDERRNAMQLWDGENQWVTVATSKHTALEFIAQINRAIAAEDAPA